MEPAASASSASHLSTAIASGRQLRVAAAMVAVSVVLFGVVAPFASRPLETITPFIPMFEAVLIIVDVITATMIFQQYAHLKTFRLLMVGAGYAYTAAIEAFHILTFPNVFSPGEILGADAQTAAWIYIQWHLTFPVILIFCAFPSGPIRRSGSAAVSSRPGTDILLAIVCAVGLAIIEALVTFGLRAALPPLTAAGHFLPLMRVLVGLSSLFCCLAGWLLLRPGAPTTLRLWLTVSMAAWCLDMLMSNVVGGGRYSLGWYAGKLYGLSAAAAVLVVYIIENGANYARLARLSETFEELARHDGLTGICNRRSFDDYLETQYRLARREGRPIALVMCDIDHFKAYNDLHGHVAGDDCLRRVAAAVQSCCRRPTDLAARYGGEEFALILPETDLEGAMRIAEMAREAVCAQRVAHGASATAPYVTISLGVAISPDPADRLGDSPSSLVEAADAALYHAKRGSRNRVAPPLAAVGSPGG